MSVNMSFVNWNDKFSIGVPEIDEHHRHLFSLLNETYDGFVNHAPPENMGVLLDALIDYATYHFSAEERWMEASGFPGLDRHKKEHGTFSRSISEMHKNYHGGMKSLTLRLFTFLHGWLSTHILESDAEFGRFVAAGQTNFSPLREEEKQKTQADRRIAHGTLSTEQ